MLQRTARKAPPAPPPVDTVDLPFGARETRTGTLHLRTQHLSAAHRTGRAPLTAARVASAELLSLLALDPSLARCDLAGALYLDTETTGLQGGTGTVAFLVGLGYWAGEGGLVVEQLLVRALGEEAPMLEHVAERIARASLLVTFNGKSFDLPLLRTRFALARIPMPDPPPHLDLLHVARRVHRGRAREGRPFECRLTSLERTVLGFERFDDTPSGEVSACYLHFLRTGDARPLLGVIEHNAWDVVAMAALVGLYGEPLAPGGGLAAEDLVGLARTLKRAGDLGRALDAANLAVEQGAGPDSIRARAEIAKARGDRAQALADWEELARAVDSAGVRLELAKLYEHFVREPARALAMVERGVAETEEKASRRQRRLRQKIEKACYTSSRMAADDTRYDPARIEPKWQRYWDEHDTFRAERHPGKPKIYVLDMFPYPSGAGLHVGHPEGYTATDIVARYKRMRGFDVLHPMGWDAFGLPAEQHAIATGTHPRATTKQNIATFKRQLKMLGFSFDWSREVDTTDPGYVKWTQWIFLELFQRGLAYQAEIPVNWCPALGTVLANEEVVDGKSERGAHPVERLPLRQWMLRITAYADRLDADLETLDWPDTKAKQHNWIGRSEGAEVVFGVDGSDETFRVFTTRVDTLAGATYVVLAPEHPLVAKLASAEVRPAVDAYVAAAVKKSEMDRSDMTREKTGVFLGAFAANPLNGERLPIWVGDYVIATYGTGAIMAVPAHDERDHAFAKKYGLPIVQVIAPADGRAIDVQAEAYTVASDEGVAYRQKARVTIPDGEPAPQVRTRVTAWLAGEGKGEARVTYKLRDWVFSRQRYWGEPIPIYFPVECAGDPREAPCTIRYDQPIAVDVKDLPLALPDLEDFRPGQDPAGPLGRAKSWRFFQKDGTWFARETNTMPQWAGSCWYYLRYLDPRNNREGWSAKAYDDWMPVDLYVGGSEHAVLHLLYARFWHKVLFDIGKVKDKEPFTRLVHQGMILGENNEKMSKSRGNVVNPDDVVRDYGADALRVYEMFMGPLEQVKPWQTSGIEGVRRFLDRVWRIATTPLGEDCDLATRRAVHKTIKKVTDDIEGMRFNTAVSEMMILVKHLGALSSAPRMAVEALALVLSPFAPHLGEEIWQRLGHDTSLAYAPWPTYDPSLVKDDIVEIGVQVNGKVRGTVTLPVDADEAAATSAAMADAKIAPHLAGKTVKKVVYVPGKILNVIVV